MLTELTKTSHLPKTPYQVAVLGTLGIHVTVLVVIYGISDTTVLEIPQFTTEPAMYPVFQKSSRLILYFSHLP